MRVRDTGDLVLTQVIFHVYDSAFTSGSPCDPTTPAHGSKSERTPPVTRVVLIYFIPVSPRHGVAVKTLENTGEKGDERVFIAFVRATTIKIMSLVQIARSAAFSLFYLPPKSAR